MAPLHANLAVALAWAAAGVKVFPCRARDDQRGKSKTPLVKWKDAATTDPVQIGLWWAHWPEAIPGLVTDGLLVIDCESACNFDPLSRGIGVQN
jgi:hypothetical protein